MKNLLAILLMIVIFTVALLYDNLTEDEINMTDVEIVEDFTRDVVSTIIGDTTIVLNVDVYYVGKTDGYDIYRTVVDSLPSREISEITLKIGLNGENRELYILG